MQIGWPIQDSAEKAFCQAVADGKPPTEVAKCLNAVLASTHRVAQKTFDTLSQLARQQNASSTVQVIWRSFQLQELKNSPLVELMEDSQQLQNILAQMIKAHVIDMIPTDLKRFCNTYTLPPLNCLLLDWTPRDPLIRELWGSYVSELNRVVSLTDYGSNDRVRLNEDNMKVLHTTLTLLHPNIKAAVVARRGVWGK